MPVASSSQRGGAGGGKEKDERRNSIGSVIGASSSSSSAAAGRRTAAGGGTTGTGQGASGSHPSSGSRYGSTGTVYKSSAGRSAAASGRNVFAGSSQQSSLHAASTSSSSSSRRGPTPTNSPSSSPGSAKKGSPSSSAGSPSGLGAPGSVRGRAPSSSPGGHGFPTLSPTAARALSTSASKSPAANSPGVTARRRRLTSTYGGDEPEESAPPPHVHCGAPAAPQASPEHAREVGFSVVTAPNGMDTDRKTGVGRCKLVYGSSTHPGNDPGGYQKDNQDAWVVKENFGNQKGIFFGVFDGHGYDGRKVSHALVNRLPKMLSSNDKFKAGRVPEAASQTCIDCNAAIKRVTTINSDLSGSTGIMAYLHANGTSLTVINVGDSRCILGKADPGGSTEGVPLNVDHTPTILEEAARIRQHRGRIGAFMHMGQPVGPLRVWLPDRDVPGLCMTRSFGDDVAATVGVYSKPEVQELTLREEDKYLILCSDGITEFMSNDDIVAFVHKHKALGPQDIAKRLVRESRKLWQAEEDDVIDDCTAIVIFLELDKGGDNSGPASSSSPAGAKSRPKAYHRASLS